MNFKPHYDLAGRHAFLGASKYHWLNYSEEKLAEAFLKEKAKAKGTELHEFAAQCIRLGIKLPNSKKTLNMYVNDAIGYKMTPEQPLYYSDYCFGTADTISFRKNLLRIHDYKSGVTPARMEQLKIYAALFCLEYDRDPNKIEIELRIYQSDQVFIYKPTAEEIHFIMSTIINFDKLLEKIEIEEV